MLVLILGLVIAVLDQVTKYAVRLTFAVGESRPVIHGFFDLTYVRNTGAAWGILGGQNASLTILSIVMLGHADLPPLVSEPHVGTSRGAGAAGRRHRGEPDGPPAAGLGDRLPGFLLERPPLAGFNVADAAICVGVGIYILSALWLASHPLHESRLKSDSTTASRPARKQNPMPPSKGQESSSSASPCAAFFLVGPTAAGKSAVAQHIAEAQKWDILSADSMLVYRGMDIGTAKPSTDERARVAYGGLDLANPDEPFSVGQFIEHARGFLDESSARGHSSRSLREARAFM